MNHYTKFFLVPALCQALVFSGCLSSENIAVNTPATPSDNIVAIVGLEQIPAHEFYAHYTRNAIPDEYAGQSAREFLPIFADYKIKVQEAYKLGYHKDDEILQDYHTFAKETALPYWDDFEYRNRLVDEFLERYQTERKSFHLLKELPPNASYADIQQIRQELAFAAELLRAGADPDSLNQEYSSVKNGTSMGGWLPWVTAGKTVKEFEDALYSLAPGEVSPPVRSAFGIHVIYFTEERQQSPERLVSHIYAPKNDAFDGLSVITEALDSLKNGQQWDDVTAAFSQDSQSISRGGNIGWVGYASPFPAPFVDEVMEADPNLSYSQILDMPYGYHIIRIDSIRTFDNPAQLRQFAENEMQKNRRFAPPEDILLENLRAAGNYSEKISIDELYSLYGQYKTNGESTPERTMFSLNGKEYNSGQFFEFVAAQDEQADFEQLLKEFTDMETRNQLVEITRAEFPLFEYETDQFLEGLMVFKFNEEFLWNPRPENESLLAEHYQANKHKYKTEPVIHYILASAPEKEWLENFDVEAHSAENETIQVQKQTVSNTQSDTFRLLADLQPGGQTHILETTGGFERYVYEAYEPSKELSFDDARHLVFQELQTQLEEQYMQQLRVKYNVQLFEKHLNTEE